MTRNKLAGQVKGLRSARRDFRRPSAAPGDRDGESEGGAKRIAGPDPTPSRDLAARELLEEALRRLSPEKRRILECREQGGQWAQVAAELGSSPEAIRKRLARAVDRVAHTSWVWMNHPDEHPSRIRTTSAGADRRRRPGRLGAGPAAARPSASPVLARRETSGRRGIP